MGFCGFLGFLVIVGQLRGSAVGSHHVFWSLFVLILLFYLLPLGDVYPADGGGKDRGLGRVDVIIVSKLSICPSHVVGNGADKGRSHTQPPHHSSP